jgi:hypothetical protein
MYLGSAMFRYKYLKQSSIVNDIQLYDLTGIDWSKFVFKRGVFKHTLTANEILKFYTVCQLYYGNLYNEDLIFLVNGISDPLELQVGQQILIPDERDITEFLDQYKPES